MAKRGRPRKKRERDYKAEYRRRLERGKQKNPFATVQQLRGHGSHTKTKEKPAKRYRPGNVAETIFGAAPNARFRKVTVERTKWGTRHEDEYRLWLDGKTPDEQAAHIPAILRKGAEFQKKWNIVAVRVVHRETEYGFEEETLDGAMYESDAGKLVSTPWFEFYGPGTIAPLVRGNVSLEDMLIDFASRGALAGVYFAKFA